MSACWNGVIRDVSSVRYLGSRKLDVIIFGASNHIGRYICMEAVNVLQHYKWGVAGRHRHKLKSTLEIAGLHAHCDLSKTPIFYADATDKSSLKTLARRCRVIVNCCGHLERIGEPLIKACIASKAHYVDMSVETHAIKLIFMKYHTLAKSRNVIVVTACGFQSLPTDVAVAYLAKHFKGTINSVDAYIEFHSTSPISAGPVAGIDAWSSLVIACSNSKKVFWRGMPKLSHAVSHKPFFNECQVADGFCLPSPAIDQDIVHASQHFFFKERRKRPIQFHGYISFPSQIVGFILAIWYIVILVLSSFNWTLHFLLKFPKFFSMGFFSAEDPDEERMESTEFKITLVANGWSMTSKNPMHDFTENPTKVMWATVSGVNPICGVACVCLLTATTTILKESGKMPRGGVFTPGAAFEKTNITDELKKYEHGVAFEIENGFGLTEKEVNELFKVVS